MQTPVQIDFQGMKPSEELRSTIDRHVTGLEVRFGRVTACRVALKAPGEHHHTGGLYAVSIHLALPTIAGSGPAAAGSRQDEEMSQPMSYASLMVHVDVDADLGGRVSVSADLAERFRAHLIGVAGWAPMSVFPADTSREVTSPAICWPTARFAACSRTERGRRGRDGQ